MITPLEDLITVDLVDLDLTAADSHKAIRALAQRLAVGGRLTDLEGFLADVFAHEAQMPTGIEGGIGIPHARSSHVCTAALGFGRSAAGVDFGAADGPAHLIFLVAAPADRADAHVSILASLARRLVHASFRRALLHATTAHDVVDLVNREVPGDEDCRRDLVSRWDRAHVHGGGGAGARSARGQPRDHRGGTERGYVHAAQPGGDRGRRRGRVRGRRGGSRSGPVRRQAAGDRPGEAGHH
jgi:PTS system fructose-specific IIA component